MKFRFLLFLLFVILTCASVQSRSRFRSSRKYTPSFKPSVTRRIPATHTSHINTGLGSSGGSASQIFLSGERGRHTKPPTIPQGVWHPNSGSSRDWDFNHRKTTPRSVSITTAAPTPFKGYPPWANPHIDPTQPKKPTAAPTTLKEYPPWANPHIDPTQPKKPVVNNNNNYGISGPHTTRSPLDTQIHGGSLPKTQSTTTTGIKPNNNLASFGNSTFPRNPIYGTGFSSDVQPTHIQQTNKPVVPGPYHTTHTTHQPFHKSILNQSQSMPIPNAPPYPLYPVHPTPMQRDHAIPQSNAPAPFGSPMMHSSISPGVLSHAPMMGQNSHVMYPNQYPHPQPNYQGSASNPGGFYSGGIYSGAPFANHGGQAFYPQQGPVSHSGSSPPVIVMPNQQDNGRGVGQIFKEALIFSGVNAAVNRIINPSQYHHHHEYSESYGRPVAATQNSETSNTHTTTHTEITYNNQYINTAPGGNGIAPGQTVPAQPQVPVSYSPGGITGGGAYQPGSTIPGAPGIVVGQPMAPGTAPVGQPVAPGTTNVQPAAPGTPLAGPPAVSNSTNISQSGQIAPPDTTVPVNGTASAPITNSPNPQETPATAFQYRITNEELQSISEELFNKDEFNAYKYISQNIQGHSTGVNVSDQAAGPLFKVTPTAYTIPTVQALRSLYQHYIPDSRVKENITMERRMKENVLLDVFLTTNVMSITAKWLYKHGFVMDDDYEMKDMLRRLWFTQYDGTSSAFERVFAAEVFNGTDVLGVQDWIHFDYHESNKRIDYLGFVDMLQFGDKAAMLKVDFRFDGTLRHNGTVFVGTSPELEMALYTICYYARPGDICPISLGGTKLNLYTNPYRYFDKDTIDLALPIF